MMTLSEMIDRLITVNIKLYNLLEKTAELDKKANKTEEDIDMIVALSGENIRLAKLRSEFKTAIDNKLNEAIKKGKTKVLDEVKRYN